MPEVPNVRPAGKMVDQTPNNEPTGATAADVSPEIAAQATGPDPSNPNQVMEIIEKMASPDKRKRQFYRPSKRTIRDQEWPPRERDNDDMMRMEPGETVRPGAAPGDIVAW